jgi:F0F1-type ATP synthase epsilon subunit
VRTFAFRIVGPEGTLAAAETDSLVLPGAAGSLGVQAGHEPWTVLLKRGAISWREPGGWKSVSIAAGVANIGKSATLILADRAKE